MSLAQERLAHRKALADSSEPFIIGSLEGLDIELSDLMEMTADHPYCQQIISSGMTANVYELIIGHRHLALKVEKDSQVLNDNGMTAFVNELVVRKAIEDYRLAYTLGLDHLSRTVYADKNAGLILSEWIDGTRPHTITRNQIESLFMALLELERVGFFEWDLCGGNLMFTQEDKAILYDFGYTYPFDMTKHIHSDGFTNKVFHTVERFETRYYAQYLMDLDHSFGHEKMMAAYVDEKEAMADFYSSKIKIIKEMGGSSELIDYYQDHVDRIHHYLRTNPYELFVQDHFRSCLLDVEDDLSAPFSNANTLMKIDKALDYEKTKTDLLETNKCYFFDWADMTHKERLIKMTSMREKVLSLMA